MISYIQEHYAEPVAIRDLTEHVHISRSECFRSFRRYTGKKPMEYINEYRLIQAADLLKETSLSVSEIGSSCGFGSSSYLGRNAVWKTKDQPVILTTRRTFFDDTFAVIKELAALWTSRL